MKKHLLIVLALVLGTLPSQAQTDVSLDPETGMRLSAGIDKKLSRGLHLTFDGEARLDNNFASFDRLQGTLGVTYKPFKRFKIGAGYSFIAGYSSNNSAFKNPRHRLLVDAQLSHRTDHWTFSLKERLQFTRRTGSFNAYQNPATAITLKSRLKAKYNGLRRFTPFASIEMRTYLNAPVIVATTDGSAWYTADGNDEGDAGWFLDGFSGIYNNRYRASIGTDYRLDRRSTLSAYLLLDYVNDKVVDANAEGTKLKSYTRETGFVGWLGLEYRYNF